jgi:hypothetical protein
MVTLRPFTGPTRAGLDRFDMRRDPVDHVPEKTLPAEPGKVHAVPSSYRGAEPRFLDSWQYEQAVCGAMVKVVLAAEFDADDPDVCSRCAENVTAGVMVRYEHRTEALTTAVVAENEWDGKPMYWAHCDACAYNGDDRRDLESAERDVDAHNREQHSGRSHDQQGRKPHLP